MSYHTPMLFTCIIVLSGLAVKGGCTCVKHESLGQITSCWVGQDKQDRYKIGVNWQRAQSNLRKRPGWTYSRGAARDSRSSMYKMYIDYDVIRLERRGKKIKIFCIACMTKFVYFCTADLFIFSAG
jgi:hypothetical protein